MIYLIVLHFMVFKSRKPTRNWECNTIYIQSNSLSLSHKAIHNNICCHFLLDTISFCFTHFLLCVCLCLLSQNSQRSVCILHIIYCTYASTMCAKSEPTQRFVWQLRIWLTSKRTRKPSSFYYFPQLSLFLRLVSVCLQSRVVICFYSLLLATFHIAIYI